MLTLEELVLAVLLDVAEDVVARVAEVVEVLASLTAV